jgi:uncharacterized protein YggE
MVIGLWTGTTRSSLAQRQVIPAQKNNQNPTYTQSALKTTKANIKISQASNVAPQLILNQRAVTVIGQGQATAPADKAVIEFRFASRDASEPPEVALPVAPVVVTELNKTALQPIVNALVAIKVPKNNIEVQTSSGENPRLFVRLDKPSRERVQQVVGVASQAIRGSRVLFLQGIGAQYAVNNCQQLESQARRIALKDAQNQVKGVAQDLDVKVGNVLLVTVFPLSGSPNSSACGSKVAVPVLHFL